MKKQIKKKQEKRKDEEKKEKKVNTKIMERTPKRKKEGLRFLLTRY